MFKYFAMTFVALALILSVANMVKAQATSAGLSTDFQTFIQQLGDADVNVAGVNTGVVNTGTFSASGFVQAGQKVGIGPAYYLQNLVADLTVYSDSFAQLYLRTGQGENSGGYFINAESTKANGKDTDQQFYVLQNGKLWAKELCVGNAGCIDEWDGTETIGSDENVARIIDRRLNVAGDVLAEGIVGGDYLCLGGNDSGPNRNCIGGNDSNRQYHFMEKGTWCGMSTATIATGLPFGVGGNVGVFPCIKDQYIPPNCPPNFSPLTLQSGMIGGFSTCVYNTPSNQS